MSEGKSGLWPLAAIIVAGILAVTAMVITGHENAAVGLVVLVGFTILMIFG